VPDKAFQMGGNWIKLVDLRELSDIVDGDGGELPVYALAVREQNGSKYGSIEHGLIVTPLLMYKVHAGDCWEIGHVAGEVKNGDSINILISIGGDNFHCAFKVSGNESEWSLHEGAAGSGGLPITPRNLNRDIGDSNPPIAAVADVSITDYGARLSGNLGRTGLERILKPNTTYLVETTNRSGKAGTMSIFVQGYKE
jgi:hypothetical protein